MKRTIFNLFLLMLSHAFVCPGSAEEAENHEAIRKLGGAIRTCPGGIIVEFQHGGRELVNKDLLAVAALGARVKELNLRDTKISSAGLRHLSPLTELRRLHLERTGIDDSGMQHVAKLTKLEYLNLYATKLTDKGLAPLAGLHQLKQLYLWQTAVSDAGVKKLQAAQPGLKIDRGVDLDKHTASAVALEAESKPVERTALTWIPAGSGKPPHSKTGEFTSVEIHNTRDEAVKLYWVEYGGGRRFYHQIPAGKRLLRNTYSEATWVITHLDETALGYFIVPVPPSRVTIPK